jgi:hypothetical protein
MKSTQQTTELFLCFAKIWREFHEAKDPFTGKVHKMACVWILSRAVPDIVTAFLGLTEIPGELLDLTTAELDTLYEAFLSELNWTPSDNTRDLFAATFALFRDLYTNLLRLKNTLHPPKAELA